MADIRLENISKRFNNDIALNDVNIEVKDKEFFIIFGPAGAGKTTLLNVIAGIHMPNHGAVYLQDQYINHVEPEDRNIAMVFEDYALYPHLSVFDNIASPLRSPRYKKPEPEIKKEVERVAGILNIEWLLERSPDQLSNGQRQRVGLGRALVREPNVYLMDEPITHLDAKLRHQMRAELKEMQKSLDTTTIYVTHDYLEALSLGDRIAVINEGQIMQVGTPEEVYFFPENEFVAGSFGEPEINIFEGDIITSEQVDFSPFFGQSAFGFLPKEKQQVLGNKGLQTIRIGLRPKDIHFQFEPVNSKEYIKGKVFSFEPLGAKAVLTVEINGKYIRITMKYNEDISINQDVYIKIDLNTAIYFDELGNNLLTQFSAKRRGMAWQN
ncbi:ABC transporter ATP-binding protein [Salibacterium aidingense]|uniref:ABC transporter ATP-binding protein n=1 Tax=Salibacterium aidingense TaxID=384933 RepID=UPI003BD0C677